LAAATISGACGGASRAECRGQAGWKLLNLDEPESVLLTEIASHGPRPDYRRGAKQFIGIICQL